jgi:hypothetical protein
MQTLQFFQYQYQMEWFMAYSPEYVEKAKKKSVSEMAVAEPAWNPK